MYAPPTVIFWGGSEMKVFLYSDGSAKENPNGPGGYGTLLHYVHNHKIFETSYSAGYKKTTNNRMELMGVITGLENLKTSCDVDVISDSKYVTDAFNQRWIDSWLRNGWKTSSGQRVKNIDLWKRLLEAKKKHNVRFYWVKGHAGYKENERCDMLATTAAAGSNLLEDVVGEG